MMIESGIMFTTGSAIWMHKTDVCQDREEFWNMPKMLVNISMKYKRPGSKIILILKQEKHFFLLHSEVLIIPPFTLKLRSSINQSIPITITR